MSFLFHQTSYKLYPYLIRIDNRKANREYLESRLAKVDLTDFKNKNTVDNFKIEINKIKLLWNDYKNDNVFRKNFNKFFETSDTASIKIRDMDTRAYTSEERLKNILEYMTDKDNWKYGFCRFLWDQHFDGKFLVLDASLDANKGESSSISLSKN